MSRFLLMVIGLQIGAYVVLLFASDDSLAQDDPFGEPQQTREAAAQTGGEQQEKNSDDPFGAAPPVFSTSEKTIDSPESPPANLPIVLGSGQRVENNAPASRENISRGLVTQSPERRAANERIDAVLDKQLKLPLDYLESPLNEILQMISDDYDIPILFDRPALEALAISEETEITVNLRNLSLRAALELMLRQVEDLTYLIDSEVLIITREDGARQRLEVRVYRVDDLVRAPETGELDFDPLIDLIINCVERESWMKHGTGQGEILPMPPGMLVIAETRRAHQQISQLLATLREVKSAIEKDAPLIDPQAANKPRTKAFRIQNVWGDDPQQGREILHEAVLKSVDWEQDEVDEDDTLLAIMPDRVIARHKPAVLRQVERTLRDLGYTKTGGVSGGRTGFGGRGAATENETPGGGVFNLENSSR